MKVLHVCFSDNVGGAFIGAHRLHSCMVATGIDSELLVIKKRTSDPGVIPAPIGLKIQNLLWRKISRLILFTQRTPDNEFRSLNLFPTTINKIINSHDADIVQFHWISDNTIGIPEFKKINKPVVWKLPDMWAFCGCEHYTTYANRYMDGYSTQNKPVDHRGLDIDRYSWEQKKEYWKDLDMTIVCPSKWLAECAGKSLLLKNYPIHIIPNPIDMDIFKPVSDIAAARSYFNLPEDKRLILFSSLAKASYTRKGFHYLDKCIHEFSRSVDKSLYKLVFMGREVHKKELHGIEVINLGIIVDINDLALAYAAMDVTIVPSDADNLPNVIKESMACGTPCVSFDTGGVPDMITHKVDGYLAPVCDHEELSRGLKWLFSRDKSEIGNIARNSAMQLHGHVKIVNRYMDLYNHILSGRRKNQTI
jgi:glycosyltransferase involved in cell wall biosynthesis